MSCSSTYNRMSGNTNLLLGTSNRGRPAPRAQPAARRSCPIDLNAMLPHNLCRNHDNIVSPRMDFTAMLPHNLFHQARNNNMPSSSTTAIQAPSRDDQILPSPHNSFPCLPHLQVMRHRQPEDSEDHHDHDSFANYGFDELLDDPHGDMRLDIDSMSNEELLALEERIGYVSTGLSEVKINKHTKYERASSSRDLCCICQDDYVARDYTRQKLDCGHGFHPGCIRRWLRVKNICPLCKFTVNRS